MIETCTRETEQLNEDEIEIIAKAKNYSKLYKESTKLTRLAEEAEFEYRLSDSKAHSLHMTAATISFRSENIGEMGFQTICETDDEVDWKQIEKDAEWAKLQVGVAEAESKRLLLESEKIEMLMKESERDLLKFLRNLDLQE